MILPVAEAAVINGLETAYTHVVHNMIRRNTTVWSGTIFSQSVSIAFVSIRTGSDNSSSRKNENLALRKIRPCMYSISPVAYDLVICGLRAVWKLLLN